MTRRTRRSVAGSVLVVLGLVVGAVIATALHADGRERSKADTNDGGAWLLKRDAGYVGHVNREVGEITAAVSVADPGSDYDVDPDGDALVLDSIALADPGCCRPSSLLLQRSSRPPALVPDPRVRGEAEPFGSLSRVRSGPRSEERDRP